MASDKARVTDKDTGFGATMRRIKRLAKGGVTIGIHSKDNTPYKRGQDANATTAQIGTFHEFGTLDRFEDTSKAGDGSGKKGVPQRSFLRATIDENGDKYERLIGKLAGKVIDGTMPIRQMLGLLGAKVVADVQKKISSGIDPPLTEAGIQSKQVESTKPLIDTGQLRQSIDWEAEL